jgi:hypothetical protein
MDLKFIRFSVEELEKIYIQVNSFLCDVLHKEHSRLNILHIDPTILHLDLYKKDIQKMIADYEGILNKITASTLVATDKEKKFNYIVYFKAQREHNKEFKNFCFVQATNEDNAKKSAFFHHSKDCWSFEILDWTTLESINQIEEWEVQKK